MATLPPSPDLSVLKTLAKTLLRAARAGDAAALRRFADTLPAARGRSLADLAKRDLKLHDAQSVIARDYGFVSWAAMKRRVEGVRADRRERQATWIRWGYDGNAHERRSALDLLAREPDLVAGDPALACAIGDEVLIEATLARDPGWANSLGGPRAMPPLLAVAHSRLILEPGFEAKLLGCASLLLRHGADVNAVWTDPRFPQWPLSVLFGAAGRNHDAAMTGLLLQAGAEPDDQESLYHSVESRDAECTRMLLEAGARVVGTNAIGRVLDYDDLDGLRLLLRHGGDARERPWMHHAVLRGRSLEHVRVLIEAGADPRATNDEGVGLCRWALQHGRTDVADFLRGVGVEEAPTVEERFVAACVGGDAEAARAILEGAPGLVSRLSMVQLEAMPKRAALGDLKAVGTMLSMGWPREVKTEWDATALNLAILRGDAAMARLLLEGGADWRTTHAFGDNAIGTLSFASRSDDIDPQAPRDYLGCARALVAHGVSPQELRRGSYSVEVAAYIEGLPSAT